MNAPTVGTCPPRRTVDRVIPAVVCALIVVCGIVVWQRDAVRARWWAHRLALAQSTQDQAYYFSMLAGLRGAAAAATVSLLEDDRAQMRMLAASLLAQMPGEASREALLQSLHDPDDGVREAAALALAFGHAADSLPQLRTEITLAPQPSALAMCVAIGRMSEGIGDAALVEIAGRHANPNLRAQAAELIGIRRLTAGGPVLQQLTSDHALVTVDLYAQRDALRAADYAKAHSTTDPASRPPQLDVAHVARQALDLLHAPPVTMPDLPDAGD